LTKAFNIDLLLCLFQKIIIPDVVRDEMLDPEQTSGIGDSLAELNSKPLKLMPGVVFRSRVV